MPLSEGVSSSLTFKAYATGVITANTEEDITTAPGASGGQVLRRVSSTLSLAVDTYQSAEVRKDRQIADFRHGGRRVQGSITGELSPASYFSFVEAVHRDTSVASISLTEADLTSAAADNTAGTFTFASGNPVTLGLRVGDVIRFTNLSEATNNAKNFLITGFGGTTNETITVSPKPTTMSADTAFTLTRPGKSTIVPVTGQVSRKFAIEHNASDIDVSRLFTECRASSYRISMPATGMTTCEFGFMGRNMQVLTASSAPYFTAPTEAGTTGLLTAVNGSLLVGGSSIGVVTGVDLAMDLSPSAAVIAGQNFAGEIFLGRANTTGTVTAYFDSAALISDFVNESEVALQVLLLTGSDANSPFISIYLPRIKFGDANLQLQGEGGQTISMPFQALLSDGTVAGVEQTTARWVDSEAA